MFSDTPPAPSFQSILCKLQPLTRHSVRHLPYYKRGATLCKFATDLFEAAVSCCNFAQGIARVLCRTFPKRVGKTHRIALFPYAAYRWKNAQDCIVSLCCLPLEKRTGYPRNSCILHRVFPLPCPAVTRVPVGKPHRIGPFPVLQFTQVWLFLAYLQLYAGCFPHRKMVVECTGCSWLNTQVCVVKLHRLYLLLI